MKKIVLSSCILFLTVILLATLLSFKQKNTILEVDNKKQATSKPNIIFILTDDQRWDALGAMGNTIIQTPNINKLANAGILFQNAYVTTSICCVSRAGIMTGQYESQHQIHDFRTDLSAESTENIYPALLKRSGYTNAFIGKFGIGSHPPQQLFDFWVNTEAGGLMQPNYITTDKNGNKIHDTDTIGHAIQHFLNNFGDKGPFCLSVSFKAPHEQDGNPPTYVIQPKYKDYYKEVTIPEPVTADPRYWNQFPDFFRTDTNFARARWKGLFNTPELYQENVKNYYRLITGVDDVVGEMMKKLTALGIADNTIIILMGDNGMFLGEHGLEGKWYGYEESIRLPLVIYNPKFPDNLKQYKAQQIALNIDIAPTIMAMAGLAAPNTVQGVDLISLVQNKIPEREDFFYQYYFTGGPQLPREEGVVTKDLKYMNFIEHNFEELFDIKHDPHETNNLIHDPAYQKKLTALRKRYTELKKIYSVPPENWRPKKSSS